MVRRVYFKNCLRKIKESFSRYISIILIVMLGMGFFIGMNSISPDMKTTAEKFFDDTNVYDIQVISTLGFKDEDIDKIKQIGGIIEVVPSYVVDVLMKNGDQDIAIRTNALKSEININYLAEGRMPEKLNECLMIDRLSEEFGYAIGDKISIHSGDEEEIEDKISVTEFTIVGIAKNPVYVSKYYGATPIGSGELLGNIFILEEVYKMDVYTNIYIKTNVDIYSKFDDDYKKEVNEIANNIERIATAREEIRYAEIYNEIKEEIDDAKKEIADGEEELRDAEEKLVDANKKLSSARKEIYMNARELVLEGAKYSLQIEDAKIELNNGKKEIDVNESNLINEKKNLENKILELQIKEKIFTDNEKYLKELDIAINQLIYTLSTMNVSNPQYNVIKRQVENLEKEYEEIKIKLSKFRDEVNTDKNNIIAKQMELGYIEEQINIAKAEYSFYKSELEKREDTLKSTENSANKKIENAVNILISETETFTDKRQEFIEKRTDALEKINDAKLELKDAEELLANLKSEWYVIPLYDSNGFLAFERDLDKIAIMGRVFPIMFFFVAGLVSLTGITRMIEEDRTSIGVLKALGYSNRKIMSKYIFYSLTSSLIGIIVGIFIGNNILTKVLYESYSILYSLPSLEINLQIGYIILAICFELFCTVIFAILVSNKELRAQPSELIRPKSPKEGKKIFLEKISFIWNRLSFNFKVTFRNIFRYKRRLFMAIIGIAGCTALIYSGLSLKSSVDSIAKKQFGEIKTYDLEINLAYELNSNDIADVIEYVNDNDKIQECAYVRQKAIDVEANNEEKEIFYAVSEGYDLKNYILLKNRKTKQDINLTDNGVIISEKLSNTLNLKVNDNITIKDEDIKYDAKVIGITENYLFNYIYMTPVTYEKIYDKEIKYNQIFVNTVELTEDEEIELADYLKENSKISGIVLTRNTNEDYQKSLESLMSIVVLFIGSSVLLSFIVLFNLNSINIDERKREYATMKVLGFDDKEIANHMFRENIIISILGGLFGLALGILMLSSILTSAEVETIMLARDLNVQNFIYAFVITIIFTLITNVTVGRNIKKINMIDSLKSIE